MRFASILFAVCLLGCPKSDGGTCTDYVPPASFDVATPTVSFTNDVLPIFQTSCAFTTCHGSPIGDANGVFLGSSDRNRVLVGLVGVKSSELTTMNFVTAGDPRQSYLMRKLDGSQCALDAQCEDGSCQGSMPKDDVTLPLDQRDVIRRWIAQGAGDD